jgi:hypothetical protein
MAVVEIARIAIERCKVVQELVVGKARLEALVATFRIIVIKSAVATSPVS